MTTSARRLTRIATLVLATLGIHVCAAAPAQRPVDQFIVRYHANVAAQAGVAEHRAVLDTVGRAHGVRLQAQRRLATGAEVVRSDRALDGESAKRLMLRLQADPRVQRVEVDRWMAPAFTPNDAGYSSQWNLHGQAGGIRAPSAWDVSAGNGVVVGVVDTGVVAHPDLSANVIGGYDFITNPATAGDGDGRDASWLDPGDFTVDGQCGFGIAGANSSWHGTRVAGVIAAVTNNSQMLAGVAFNGDVLALRALGRCGGRLSDIADAIVWAAGGTVPGVAANPNPVDVLNLSFSGLGPCDAETQAAIDFAHQAGVVVVAAAGNRAADVSGETPGSCANVVAVGASNAQGARASYSNFGAGIDLVAPGGDASSGVPMLADSGLRTPVGGTSAFGQGSSLAAAHVSGVAAQMQALQANAPDTVAAILRGTARPLVSPCAQGCGAGILDASFAVRAARGPVVVMSDAPTVSEGDTGTRTATFTLRLSHPLATPVTFDIATADGTATAGSDYVGIALSGEAFAPGETLRSYAITINGDTTFELDESFTLAVSNLVGADGIDLEGQATIVNDDVRPLLNGVPIPNLAGATGSNQWFVIDVPENVHELLIATSGGTGDVDLSIYRGSRNGTYMCGSSGGTNDDACRLPNPPAGQYFIRLYGWRAYSGASLAGSYSIATLSIDDLALVENDAGAKLVSVVVRLSHALTQPATVDVELASGTATQGVDFTTSGFPGIHFEPGERVKVMQATIVGDTDVEPNETFAMTLVNPVGVTLGDAQATATILNNDGPTLTVQGVSLAEGNAGTRQASFVVRLSQPAAGPVTYSFATAAGTALAGSDFDTVTLASQTLPAGMTAQVVTVPVSGDTAIEANETFTATIGNASGASILHGNAIGTILNDDGPRLSILDASISEGTGATKTMSFSVQLSQPAATTVSFVIATQDQTTQAGIDYSGHASTRYLQPGQTGMVLNVVVNGDATVEANERMLVNLTNATGATIYDGQAIGTIYNDDGPTLSVNDVSISEGNSGTKVATFTVALSQAAAAPITYDIATSNMTAVAGSDYVAKSLSNETIPAGQLSKTFTVTLNGDATVEANESFRVTLSNISAGATLFKYTGTGTIINDD